MSKYLPKPRSRWRHKKTGTVYWVLAVGLLETGLVPHVVYTEDCDDESPLWLRPVVEFLDGRFEPYVPEDELAL